MVFAMGMTGLLHLNIGGRTRRFPYHSKLLNVHKTLRVTSYFTRENAEVEQQRLSKLGVLDAVKRSPQSSIRKTSMAITVALTQVWKTSIPFGFIRISCKEYTQHYLPEDHAPRVQCFEWLQAQLVVLPDILFMDEAQFTHDITNNTLKSHLRMHKIHTG
jgi:hypothetical protein